MGIQISQNAQFAHFVDFARQQMQAGNAKAIARADGLSGMEGARKVTPASGDRLRGLFRPRGRTAVDMDANNAAREAFRNAVADMFGGEKNIPKSVKSAMLMGDYGKGKPLTARRIVAVDKAIESVLAKANRLAAGPDITKLDMTGGNHFPATLEEARSLEVVRPLGGHSGASTRLVKDADGRLYVMKSFSVKARDGMARLKEECEADAFYIKGGAKTPPFKLYGDGRRGYVKLSLYIPKAVTLNEAWARADEATKEKIRASIAKHFALDVIAGAWDVLGMEWDNILVDDKGECWRCDNGGAFRRRAQGGLKKNAQWENGRIDDLWTMRGKHAAPEPGPFWDPSHKGDVFGGISTRTLLADINGRDWTDACRHLPKETRAVVEKRIAWARTYHRELESDIALGKVDADSPEAVESHVLALHARRP